MQQYEANEVQMREGEKLCIQCQKSQPFAAFSYHNGKSQRYRKICSECAALQQSERHRRVALQREKWQWEVQGQGVHRQDAWIKRVSLRQAQEERWHQRELWYLQQPDRQCKACRQILPASAFGGTPSPTGFLLHTRCRGCHQAQLERCQLPCCLCQKKKPRRSFLSHYDGYALCGDGTYVSLCCKECETAFRALPHNYQEQYIHSCSLRAFPTGQVIYAEIDPETGAIRYVGRTGRPERRHAQHLQDASPTPGQLRAGKKSWFTCNNWIYTLAEKELVPWMQILQHINITPLVVEWEQRYIWHGIQHGWQLLNSEAMDQTLIERIRTSPFEFLTVPFEILVQRHFFSSHGLVAFLHHWFHSEACI
jgi:hypothetical protein